MSTIPGYPAPDRALDGTELVPIWENGQRAVSLQALWLASAKWAATPQTNAKIFADTSSGIAGTSAGDFFWIISGLSLELYRNVAGAAIDQGVSSARREVLVADRTYYVAPGGSDSHDGRTSGTAFATIQKAISVIYSVLDLNGHTVTISLANGTYASPITVFGRLVGAWGSAQPLQIIGNEATPANVIIDPNFSGFALTMAVYPYLLLAGVTLKNSGGSSISASDYALLEHRNCVFGATSATGERIITQHNAVVRAIGPTTVTGNGKNFCHATKHSIIDFSNQTLTYTGTPAFSNYLLGVNDASINFDTATIVGTATGIVFVHDKGILNVSSLTGNYLGGSAPIQNDGGIIVAADKYGARTFYVLTTGNDNNDGLANSSDRAFRTLQGAINAIAQLPYNPVMWVSGGTISIVCGAGTYNEAVTLRQVQCAPGVIFLGDETTPANCNLTGVSDGFIASGLSTLYWVRGFRIHAAIGRCLNVQNGSQVTFRNCEFSDATLSQLYAQNGGRIIAEGNYTIVGSSAYHARAYLGGSIDLNGVAVTLTGTIAYSTAFAEAEIASHIRASGMSFTGSATGKRYDVTGNSIIYTGGGVTFPGSIAGTTSTGGQFA